MTQRLIPVDAKTQDWPRKVATALNSLINTSAAGAFTATWGSITGTLTDQTDLTTALSGKQATLVSGTNIKTVNSSSLLGSGNLSVGTVTSVDASGGTTGLSFTGGPITSSGTVTLSGTLAIANGGTGSTTAAGARVALLPSLTGNTLKTLRVNAGETDVEWATASGSGTVTTTGTPASGNLAKFSGSTSITNGDLSGDVTTSGTLAAVIPNNTVTYAKMQDVSATSKLLGRYSSGSGDPEEIALNASFTVSGGTLARVFRGALAKKSADQTAATYTTFTAIAWDAEDYDTDSIHDNVTNNTRLTVPSGVTKVRLTGVVQVSSLTANVWAGLVMKKNGADFLGMGEIITQTANTTCLLSCASAVITVTSGDYFELLLGVQTDTSITVVAAISAFGMEILA